MTVHQAAALVRDGTWSRAARGVYDTRHLGPSPFDDLDRRRRRAAIVGVLAHPGSVATGVCALVLHGVKGAPLTVTPEVTFPDGSPRARSGAVRVRRIGLRRWFVLDGIPCVSVADGLAQAVPTVDRRTAVALMDSARHERFLLEADFRRARAADRRRPGGLARAAWWAASDSRAESPAETWARLSCVDSGCPPDGLQLRVDDDAGRFLARVDLAWILSDGGALLVEVDGRDVHGRLEALYADRQRQNRLTGRSTIVLRFTGRDAREGRVGPTVRETLRRAGWCSRPLADDARLRLPA